MLQPEVWMEGAGGHLAPRVLIHVLEGRGRGHRGGGGQGGERQVRAWPRRVWGLG